MNDSPAPSVSHQDRSTGLLVFGILTILMGALCALFVVLMLSSQALVARDPSLANPRSLIPGVVLYGALAVAFVWLGIGSIRARRWARALLVILSGGWLLMGIGSLIAVVLVLPSAFSGDLPGEAKIDPATLGVITTIITGFTGIVFVLIPAIWAFFYSGKNVRATCEHRDPVVRWTDRCPLPVLGVSLWTALLAFGLLFTMVAGTAVVPLFGFLLAGFPAAAVCLGLALLWFWAAWRLYRCDILAWWIVVVSMVGFTISSILTYSRHNLSELYTLMGYSPAQIAAMEPYALPQAFVTWGILLWILPVLGFLLYIRRYFRAA
jgi:hypothetical protein